MTEAASSSPKCPQCGASLPPDAPEGLCARCLARLCLARDSVVTNTEAFAADPPSPEEIAPSFPQLELIACLGRGGMGVVYKARQKSLDRFVALKILAPEREKDPQFAERFAREAQALARLSHPHIVTIYDFGQTDGLFFLLMEFVDGLNLRELLRTRRLEPPAALAIVPPVCEALQYAHDRGVVHRDIKPENLLLDKSGQIKIADFGIAKMLGKEAAIAGEPCAGTPAYMAPEQSAAADQVDHRADIYSLGVVLYEMLTGELPAGQFAVPSRKVQVDVRLDEIVLRALERQPELRFQQASQMQTAAETIVNTRRQSEPDVPTPGTPSLKHLIPWEFSPMFQKKWISMALWSLFIAANLFLFYTLRKRAHDNEPVAPVGPVSDFTSVAQRGSDAFEKREYANAATAWEEAIRLDPNHSEAHRWLGDALLNQSKADEALAEYEKSLALNPNNAMAYVSRGMGWTEKGAADKALADFKRATELRPDLANRPHLQKYLAAAESLRTGDPKFNEVIRRGLDAFRNRDFAKALVEFDEACRLDPDHSNVRRYRGDALLNLRELDKALEAYDEAIKLDPKNAMAYMGRGAVLTEKKQTGPALVAFGTAVDLDPAMAERPFYKRYLEALNRSGR